MNEKRFSISEEELGQVSGGSLGQAGIERPQPNAVGVIPKPGDRMADTSLNNAMNSRMTVRSWCDGEKCKCMRDFYVSSGGRGICSFCKTSKFL